MAKFILLIVNWAGGGLRCKAAQREAGLHILEQLEQRRCSLAGPTWLARWSLRSRSGRMLGNPDFRTRMQHHFGGGWFLRSASPSSESLLTRGHYSAFNPSVRVHPDQPEATRCNHSSSVRQPPLCRRSPTPPSRFYPSNDCAPEKLDNCTSEQFMFKINPGQSGRQRRTA